MKGKVSQFCAVVTEDKPIIYFSITNQPPKDQWSGFPGGSAVKNLPANAGDTGSIPGTGRAPREENGNLLQYFCLRNPMSRRVWWATVHGVAKELVTT